jgi:hypothetical protein
MQKARNVQWKKKAVDDLRAKKRKSLNVLRPKHVKYDN